MLKRNFENVEDNKILYSIKQGMILAIPAIMTGSIALVILNLPIKIYQEYIASLFNGEILNMLTFINDSTLGIISLIILLTISYSYGKIYGSKYTVLVPIVAMCSFLVFSHGSEIDSYVEIFKTKWLFTAIIVSITSSMLFVKLTESFITSVKFHTEGADADFNMVVSAIIPFITVVFLFSILRVIVINLIGSSNFQDIFYNLFSNIFNSMGRNLMSALLFIFLMHFMWFFGIHGSNVLDTVAKNLFENGMAININLVNNNQLPTEIFTKTFFDTMVLFGGCGALLCLVIAIFLSEKRINVRKLAKIASIPALFNINEMLVFGIPIVFNYIMFIPFIITPMILTITSYVAMSTGIVPCTVSAVEWTSPIFLSGYMATDSIRGSLLQLFNLCVGVMIYIPFIKMSQNRYIYMFKNNIENLTNLVKKCELTGEQPNILNHSGKIGSISKMLASDLKFAMKKEDIEIFYQPQVNYDGNIVGAEGLLRWRHSIGGFIYPPLVILLAKEEGFLDELGEYIINKACVDLKKSESLLINPIKFSVNISPDQLNAPNLPEQIKNIIENNNINPNMLGIEITEQVALSGSQIIIDRINAIHDLGIKLIMDDFGMGHSSLVYLQNNNFDIVKLDGSLVKEILTNKRSSEIIMSIVNLSKNLDFDIIVEYVENLNQRDKLYDLGCEIYQGYYYSKAIPFEEFIDYANRELAK
ncbi:MULTISPECIES: EAL domain-containing protein [unclassified Clostridioides]|uniref:EAL domain-containing protein n=1 Tax=unclassified Clostridioides TaxID=2635829 RepID=UPI001D0FA070|nr:PTS sugar transporter subunit IIC/EAL domain-containing protein [Clostridioides sp. ES-S-0049-03]MCC0677564.1 PTS sugar transporter subunit IIC/EAL domain-containing protein [Clostridioides sp. ES-W-0018-02]MCC0682067.1 PTS sugar transporter subunit IIC/EAL domain-containing protein [Clostridioides sp. ES-S-0005-03]MCC0712196.1 PTS sugar transporter subunit IIC/EAL domain-containing protein [Clostridioides sp. ES-W-0017-02]UDN47544.1 PTS sugar transporter subunit IIC/EAL domain-containing pr